MRNLHFPALLRLLTCLLVLLPLPAVAATLVGEVVYVSDGDTLELRTPEGGKERIRLAEIDAPEKDQPHGLEAKEALMQRVKGRSIEVEYAKRDRYGRIIGRILLDGRDLNGEMVRDGHAWVYRQYSDFPDLLRLEEEAQAKGIGLWAEPNPIAPWEWRRRKKH
jgi:endonuclease YncB( thermonuclease family)